MAQIHVSLYWLEVTSSGFVLVWKIISSPLIFLLHVTFLKALSLNEVMKSERSRVTWWVVQGLWDPGLAPWGAKCSGTFLGHLRNRHRKSSVKKPLILCLRIEYLILNYSYYWKNLLEMNVRFFLLLRQMFRSLSPLLSHFLSHMHTHSLPPMPPVLFQWNFGTFMAWLWWQEIERLAVFSLL